MRITIRIVIIFLVFILSQLNSPLPCALSDLYDGLIQRGRRLAFPNFNVVLRHYLPPISPRGISFHLRSRQILLHCQYSVICMYRC
jgi:hypothetical protein